MNRRLAASVIVIAGLAGAAGSIVSTQGGQGAPDWTTGGGDAQRSGWVRADPWISPAGVARPDFGFIWKLTLDNEPRFGNALTAPVSAANVGGFRGIKSIVFVGGSSDNVYAIDYDLGTLVWKTHLNYSSRAPLFGGSARCPGGMTSPVARASNLVPATQMPYLGFAGPPQSARSEVGQPGRGAPQLAAAPASAAAPAVGGRSAAPQGATEGVGGATPTPAAGRAGGAGRGRGGNTVFTIGGDGFARSLLQTNGADAQPPAVFLPASAKAAGTVVIDNVLYATTADTCGAGPNGVWAIDLANEARPTSRWDAGDASVVGSFGVAFGGDGTVYAATGPGSSAMAASVVALERTTLRLKDWVTVPGARFTSSPLVFEEGGSTFVAVASADGRVHLLSGDALGGSSHATPLFSSAAIAAPGFEAGAMATWRDGSGTRWILAPIGRPTTASTFPTMQGTVNNGAIAAFRMVTGQAGPRLEPAWTSRDLVAPQSPIVINGVVFALSSGEFRDQGLMPLAERATRSSPAVLYALDPETGKELWNSGTTIATFSRTPLAAGTGQVFVVAQDNTLYAFGVRQFIQPSSTW